MGRDALTVGTRGSSLAMEQTRRVTARLGCEATIRVISTRGDRSFDEPLGDGNPVGFFTREIEEELLAGRIDIAVHSLKDLPVQLAPGLTFGAMLERDDPADILLVRREALDTGHPLPLKKGAAVGVCSGRRGMLLESMRPDLSLGPIRGNVPTRVQKVLRGDFDATLLSRAGLSRLGLDVGGLAAFELNPRRWPVAPGQAVIAVEARSADARTLERLRPLDHAPTRQRVNLERSLLAAFGGGCHAPFGAFCEEGDGEGSITVAAPGKDGVVRVERFAAAALGAARMEAEEWICGGCPRRSAPDQKGEEWLCRPARSWC